MNIDEIVVGDLVILRMGMEIIGDGILIEGDDVKVDESSMTGETNFVHKDILSRCMIERERIWEINGKEVNERNVPTPVLLSGTKVMGGEGLYIVINVGKNSAIGKIHDLVQTNDNDTPLKKKLGKIAEDIGKFGLISAILTLIFLIAKLFYDLNKSGQSWESDKHIQEVIGYFIIAITIIVVAIPEGLPLAVTLALAYSIKQMMKEKNLVRKLYACEIMGGADVICSDKTGTLTKNEMNLTHFWNKNIHHIFKATSKKQLTLESFISNKENREMFVDSIIANSVEDPDSEIGSETELAILKYLSKMGINVVEKRNHYDITKRIPFSSARKRMSTIVRLPNGHFRLYIKGASELILDSSIDIINLDNGVKEKIDEKKCGEINLGVEKMAQMALRTIGLAYKDLENFYSLGDCDEYGVYPIEKTDLTLVGIFGIMDILRPGVQEAVQVCLNAGVRVRMITGDNRLTAIAIARNCGILGEHEDPEGAVMKGSEFMEKIGGIICKKCLTRKCPCPRNNKERDLMLKGKLVPHQVRIIDQTPDTKKGSDANNHEVEVIKPSLKKENGGIVKKKKGNKKKKSVKINLDPQEMPELDYEKIQKEVSKQKKQRKKKEVDDKKTKSDKFQVREDTIADKDGFKKIMKDLKVLARSRPEDKYAIIVGLREKGHVVAVTGDGTNDAPALKKADVGFAMGNTGTDIAKQAADIILTDDNFCSIVNAIVWGRNIYDSIKKFLMFQLTVNLVAVIITFIGGIMLRQPVITAVQMLWINLIMDTLASLALATELPNWEILLSREPYKKEDYIISMKMFKHILGQTIFQLIVLVFLVFRGEKYLPDYRKEYAHNGLVISGRKFNVVTGVEEYGAGIKDPEPSMHFTYIFNIFVMFQVFNFINARKLNDELNVFEGLGRSKMFIWIVLMIVVIQFIMITFGNTAMSVAKWGLDYKGWLISLAFGLMSLIVSFLLKILPFESCCCFCCKKKMKKKKRKGKKSAYSMNNFKSLNKLRTLDLNSEKALSKKSSLKLSHNNEENKSLNSRGKTGSN